MTAARGPQPPDAPRRPDPRDMPRRSELVARPVLFDPPAEHAGPPDPGTATPADRS